jgi:hypothetical protein
MPIEASTAANTNPALSDEDFPMQCIASRSARSRGQAWSDRMVAWHTAVSARQAAQTWNASNRQRLTFTLVNKGVRNPVLARDFVQATIIFGFGTRRVVTFVPTLYYSEEAEIVQKR